MSFYLLLSSFVTSLLVPEKAYQSGGEASGRAIAYLAHELFGHGFGSLYDMVTILILWFAGASAMAGLLNVIPRYLPRFGMAPRWVSYRRPLVLVLFAITVLVTWIFDANVEAQSGAYATGVLALMLSAAVAVALANWWEGRNNGERGKLLLSIYFWFIAAVFAYTLAENILSRPDGVIISSIFIVVIIGLSAVSRFLRATELRVDDLRLVDDEAKQLWEEIVGKRVNLVPLEHASVAGRRRKKEEIRRYYQVKGPLAFLHVDLLDNRSEFVAPLRIHMERDGADYFIRVSGAVAIANTVAYVSEQIDPISIFLGLTRESLMTQSLHYLLWGEGESGLMVYKILLRYWEWTPESDVRPSIFLMSE